MQAAEASGLEASAWLRSLGLREAKRATGRKEIVDNETILKDAGFEYLPRRMLWISRYKRMGFSGEAISDHDEAWVQERLDETVAQGEFWFWFSGDIPKSFPEDSFSVLAEIGLSELQPKAPIWRLHVGG
ncbi:MAG: hypothetical protein WCB16_05185 [Candidatus Binatus sp.]